MKKFIGLAVITSLAGAAYFYKDRVELALTQNDYRVVANQYWHQLAIDPTPGHFNKYLNRDVMHVDFNLGEAFQEDGKYYFDTYATFNGAGTKIYTVVESQNGEWFVNEAETFNSANNANLNHTLDNYKAMMHTTANHFDKSLVKGKATLTDDDKKAIEAHIDAELNDLKQAILEQYFEPQASE